MKNEIAVIPAVFINAKPVESKSENDYSGPPIAHETLRQANNTIGEMVDQLARARGAYIDNDPAVLAVRVKIAKLEKTRIKGGKKNKNFDYVESVKLSNEESEAVESAANRFDEVVYT